VINKTASPIYFRGNPDLISCGVYNNEKVYYVTLNLDFNINGFLNRYKSHNMYFDIHTKIGGHKTRKFNQRGNINKKNNYYERDMMLGIMDSQYSEFCSDVYFLFFYAKNPYTVNSYTEYVEIMKNDGHAVLGYRHKNKIFFTITDNEMQVNYKAINDVLFFVHTLYDENARRRKEPSFNTNPNTGQTFQNRPNYRTPTDEELNLLGRR
jgi:beta-galactosidase beta subunit